MSVFTVYCHGSGGHRHKADKEIVANFGRRAHGNEYENYLILDGVGGHCSTKKHPGFAMAGSFNWADKDKSPKADTPVELGGGHATKNSSIGGARANARGEGVEDNARHAIVTIANLHPFPKTVNLIGWSRGSVTALMIANLLNDSSTQYKGMFPKLKVNIFAIDPVAGKDAGLGPKGKYFQMIPRSVKNCVIILAKGENRQTFKPQDLSRIKVISHRSNVVFLPFPGKHSTVAQNCDERATDVSDLVWTMADHFLKKFGTRQNTDAPLKSMEGMLDSYSAIVLKKNVLATIKQSGAKQRAIGMGFATREFTKHLNDYTMNDEYFVNEHHRQLFEHCARSLYNWLFTGFYRSSTFTQTVMESHPVYADLKRLQAWKQFIQSMEQLGVRPEQKTAFIVPPAGAFYKQNARNNLNPIQQQANLWKMGLMW